MKPCRLPGPSPIQWIHGQASGVVRKAQRDESVSFKLLLKVRSLRLLGCSEVMVLAVYEVFAGGKLCQNAYLAAAHIPGRRSLLN